MKSTSIVALSAIMLYVLSSVATADSAESIFKNLEKTSKSEEAYKLIKIGFESYNEGDCDKAIMYYNFANAVDQNSYAAWAGKTLAYNKLGKYDEAIKSYNMMIKKNRELQNEINKNKEELSNIESVHTQFLPALFAVLATPEVAAACVIAAATIITVYLSPPTTARTTIYYYNNTTINTTIPMLGYNATQVRPKYPFIFME